MVLAIPSSANKLPVLSTASVSYTHLDVYKRQALVTPQAILSLNPMITAGDPGKLAP